jgi:hypothetical protein
MNKFYPKRNRPVQIVVQGGCILIAGLSLFSVSQSIPESNYHWSCQVGKYKFRMEKNLNQIAVLPVLRSILFGRLRQTPPG